MFLVLVFKVVFIFCLLVRMFVLKLLKKSLYFFIFVFKFLLVLLSYLMEFFKLLLILLVFLKKFKFKSTFKILMIFLRFNFICLLKRLLEFKVFCSCFKSLLVIFLIFGCLVIFSALLGRLG